MFLLMKKAKCHEKSLEYKQFVTAVEQILNDVKIDPFQVVKEVLMVYFREATTITLEGAK